MRAHDFDFYVRVFSASVVFEATWFVVLQIGAADDGRAFSLAFMTPDHPSRPPWQRRSMARA